MLRTVDEVNDFFNSHWTVRKYSPYVMPAEDLDAILNAAQRAPTDATAQMYSMIRLTSEELRRQVAELSENPHIVSASESFIVCADVHRLGSILQSQSFEMADIPHIAIHFAIGDAVLAGQNMLIAAELLGYRGCWIGGIITEPEAISERLKLPWGVFPFAGLTIGKPSESPKHRPRLPRQHIFHDNSYQIPSSEELALGLEEMAAITRGGNWAVTLNRYFGLGGSMEEREIKLRELLQKKIFKPQGL